MDVIPTVHGTTVQLWGTTLSQTIVTNHVPCQPTECGICGIHIHVYVVTPSVTIILYMDLLSPAATHFLIFRSAATTLMSSIGGGTVGLFLRYVISAGAVRVICMCVVYRVV